MLIAYSPGLVRFLRAVFINVTLIVGPYNRLIDPDTASLKCIKEILRQTSPDAAYFLPSTLEALYKTPQYMKSLSKLKLIGFEDDKYQPLRLLNIIPADTTIFRSALEGMRRRHHRKLP